MLMLSLFVMELCRKSYSGEPRALRLPGSPQHGDQNAPAGPERRDQLGALRELSLSQAGRPLA